MGSRWGPLPLLLLAALLPGCDGAPPPPAAIPIPAEPAPLPPADAGGPPDAGANLRPDARDPAMLLHLRLEESLAALARLQHRDGSWGGGPADSGLALLAFLGYGETHKTPRHGAVVRAGAKYLTGCQDPEGCFGPRSVSGWMEGHALATLAMVELYGMTGSPFFRPPVEKALRFLLSRRRVDGGWADLAAEGGLWGPWAGTEEEASDPLLTAWAALALREGVTAGVIEDDGLFAPLPELADRWEAARTLSVPMPPPDERTAGILCVRLQAARAAGEGAPESLRRVLLAHRPGEGGRGALPLDLVSCMALRLHPTRASSPDPADRARFAQWWEWRKEVGEAVEPHLRHLGADPPGGGEGRRLRDGVLALLVLEYAGY